MHHITLTKDFPFKSKNDVVEIFIRLRGYSELPGIYNSYNQKMKEKNIMRAWVTNRNLGYLKGFRSPEQRPRSVNFINKGLTSPQKNKKKEKKIDEEELKKIKRKKNIIPEFLYYTFTSTLKSNKLIISKTPLRGEYIINKIKTSKDLNKIRKIKLKESKIYEYDSVFNETDEISDLYKQIIESKVKRMFNGFNSCMFIMGPKKSGKSYLLLGENKNKGLLTYSINTILNYITLSQNDMICFYGIAASYLITISVDQFYLNYRDSLFNETIIFGIMNFNTILERINEERHKLNDKYRIQDLMRKSHLLVTFTLYQNNTGDLNLIEKNNNLQKLKELNEIQEISKFSFIEMNDATYGFFSPENPIPKIYRETNFIYEEIANLSIQLSRKIQPYDPQTFFMQYLYDTVISCGTNIIILLCANPCDPHIEISSKILIWGFNLRKNLYYAIDNNNLLQFNNNNFCCKYIDNFLFVEDNQFEINSRKNKKKKKGFGKLNKLKDNKMKYDDKENEFYYSKSATNYQTLKDFENTNKEIEKIKKEQQNDRDKLNIIVKNLEEQVYNLTKTKFKTKE